MIISISLVLLIVAGILALLALLNVAVSRVNIVALGLLLVVIALIFWPVLR